MKLSLKKERVISKVNEQKIRLSGPRVFSWLAGMSCRIGLQIRQSYKQDSGLEINKIDPFNATLVAQNDDAIEKLKFIQTRWRSEQPDGVNMSRPGE